MALEQEWMRSKGLPIQSAATASYAEARKALPMEMLREVNKSLCDQLDQSLSIDDFWRGFRVKAEDGTSAQMPDTPANQEAYPQPSGQAPGCGFPVIGLVGLIDLNHGGLRDFSENTVETGELRGHDQLEAYLGPVPASPSTEIAVFGRDLRGLREPNLDSHSQIRRV